MMSLVNPDRCHVCVHVGLCVCMYVCQKRCGISTDLINSELPEHRKTTVAVQPRSDNNELLKDLTGSHASQTHVNQLHLVGQTPNGALQVSINSRTPRIV